MSDAATPRHLLDSAGLDRDAFDTLFYLADEGFRPGSLTGLTTLTAFYQESTRTRLGFLSAAARQGAAALDMGPADRLRLEPRADQLLVLSTLADVVVVRHGDASFARDLAAQGRCSVIDGGSGALSHPTQSLIDLYTLSRTLTRDLAGVRVVFIGPLLRSAITFAQMAGVLGVEVVQHDVLPDPSLHDRESFAAAIKTADVVYIQSLSDTRYEQLSLNQAAVGPKLPAWTLEAIVASEARIMHALPRGPELADDLMWREGSLVARQLEYGLAIRSAVLSWVAESR